LKVEPLFCEWIRHHVVDWEHCVVVSPDEGGAKRSASLANDLILDFAIVSNR
jgi:ribose-phosphate pyrophosphokinase